LVEMTVDSGLNAVDEVLLRSVTDKKAEKAYLFPAGEQLLGHFVRHQAAEAEPSNAVRTCMNSENVFHIFASHSNDRVMGRDAFSAPSLQGVERLFGAESLR